MTKGKRQLKAEITKQRIFQTALELFQKKGFNQVTVDEIVKKSNSSKGAFYGHFNSKYDIFLEKFKEIDSFYESFVQTIPEDLPFKEKILILFHGQMKYLEEELGKDLMRCVYTSGLIEIEENFFANTNRGIYKIITRYIEVAKEQGEFVQELDANKITMFITRCMRGTLYDWLVFGKEFQLQQESRLFVNIFIDGLISQYSEKDQNI